MFKPEITDVGNHVDTSTGTIEDVDVDNDLDIQETEKEVDSTGNASYQTYYRKSINSFL